MVGLLDSLRGIGVALVQREAVERRRLADVLAARRRVGYHAGEDIGPHRTRGQRREVDVARFGALQRENKFRVEGVRFQNE